jgi:hypothetical protein
MHQAFFSSFAPPLWLGLESDDIKMGRKTEKSGQEARLLGGEEEGEVEVGR